MSPANIVAALPTVWLDRVGSVHGIDIVGWDLDTTPERANEIQFVCMPDRVDASHWEHLSQANNVRHVQLLSAGFEHALPYIPDGARLANARGVFDAPTSEQALALTLAAQRDAWHWFQCRQEQRWEGIGFQPGVADQRVLIVGYGSIGAAVARRLTAFEPASITAVASRARAGDELVSQVHGVDALPQLLPQADIVISVLPANENTAKLIDADFLAAMPKGALLVNIGRGAVVDTEALVEACREGRIRAALDVTDPEPLPDGHPLWTCPGVLISPHMGGLAHSFWVRAPRLITTQLQHLAAGEPLENIVH